MELKEQVIKILADITATNEQRPRTSMTKIFLKVVC